MVLSAREFLNILDSFTLYGSILGFNMVIFVFFVHGNIAIKGMCQLAWQEQESPFNYSSMYGFRDL